MNYEIQHCKNYTEIAGSHLLEQHKNKPFIKGLLKAIITPLQKIEDRLFEIYKNADLNKATGYYLDRIGDIIGEDRNYREDEPYRLAIRIRIIANNGGATPDEIIVILRNIYSAEVKYSECGRAYFQINIKTPKKPKGINAILATLKPVGVSTPSVIYTEATTDLFRFSESCKEEDKLLIKTGDRTSSLKMLKNEVNTKKLQISFDSFEKPSNTRGFAEIIVHRFSIKLDDQKRYLINESTKLEAVMGYDDFKIEGGSCFAEVIENE